MPAALKSQKNVCEKYIGLHGTYPDQMRIFWNSTTPFNPLAESERSTLVENSDECTLVHNFNFLNFNHEWNYEPARCIYKPSWETGKQKVKLGIYVGRESGAGV